MPEFKAGHIFDNGKGGGYKLTRDISPADHLRASDFEAFGGEQPSKAGLIMPSWLGRQLNGLD